MTGLRSWLGLAGWVLLCFVVAWFGSRYSPGTSYQVLRKPAWTPPAWVFGPVWTVLYALMGVAAWLVWKEGGFGHAAIPLSLFLLQLALNGAWSWLFFGLEQRGVACVEILLLWLAILATLITFWNARPLAGALLLPYLAWVSFAAALNFAIWRMNR